MHSTIQLNSLDWHGLGRRRFLRWMTQLGAAAALAPLATGCSDGDNGPVRLMVFSKAHATTLEALAQAVVPTQEGFPTVGQAQVVQRLDEELWLSDPSIQDDMRAALGAAEWLPFIYGYPGRFSRLSLEQRRILVQSWMDSPIELVRAIGTNLKLVSHFMYFGHPSAWAAIGYDGPFQKLPPIASEQRKAYAIHVAGGTQ